MSGTKRRVLSRRVSKGTTWSQRRKVLIARLEYIRTMTNVDKRLVELGEKEQFFLAAEILQGDLQNESKKEGRAKSKKGGKTKLEWHEWKG